MRGIIGPLSHGRSCAAPDVVVGVDVAHSALHPLEQGREVARAGEARCRRGSRPCARVTGRYAGIERRAATTTAAGGERRDEPLDGVRHQRRVAALEPVGEHDRQRAAGAVGVARRGQELVQRRPDARAAVGVLDDRATRRPAPRRRRARAAACVIRVRRVPNVNVSRLRGPREAQVVRRVLAQRAGDVDQQQQRARAVRAAAAREHRDLARARGGAQRAAQVDAAPRRCGPAPARADPRQVLVERACAASRRSSAVAVVGAAVGEVVDARALAGALGEQHRLRARRRPCGSRRLCLALLVGHCGCGGAPREPAWRTPRRRRGMSSRRVDQRHAREPVQAGDVRRGVVAQRGEEVDALLRDRPEASRNSSRTRGHSPIALARARARPRCPPLLDQQAERAAQRHRPRRALVAEQLAPPAPTRSSRRCRAA